MPIGRRAARYRLADRQCFGAARSELRARRGRTRSDVVHRLPRQIRQADARSLGSRLDGSDRAHRIWRGAGPGLCNRTGVQPSRDRRSADRRAEPQRRALSDGGRQLVVDRGDDRAIGEQDHDLPPRNSHRPIGQRRARDLLERRKGRRLGRDRRGADLDHQPDRLRRAAAAAMASVQRRGRVGQEWQDPGGDGQPTVGKADRARRRDLAGRSCRWIVARLGRRRAAIGERGQRVDGVHRRQRSECRRQGRSARAGAALRQAGGKRGQGHDDRDGDHRAANQLASRSVLDGRLRQFPPGPADQVRRADLDRDRRRRVEPAFGGAGAFRGRASVGRLSRVHERRRADRAAGGAIGYRRPRAGAANGLSRSAPIPNPTAMTDDQRFGLSRHVVLPGPLALDGGALLAPVEIAYETYGSLDADRRNAILICHALTGDQHVASDHPVTGKPGWWTRMVGPGKPIDSARHFVVCANVLGSCMGSSGSASTDPATGKPYAMAFPVSTIRDMVRAQAMLLDYLGVGTLLAVVGGSMGGMQALSWPATFPDRVRSAVVIASTARHTAQNIAFHEVGRQALMADPKWQNGDYYAAGDPPAAGLAVARMAAHITYLSEAGLTEKFGRRLQAREAKSYGFDADWLYPTAESRTIVHALNAAGAPASFVELSSPFGHDAFLLDAPEMNRVVDGFLRAVP